MALKKTVLTLVLITKNNKILLGLKKRGFGMGKFNGFGGKLEAGETIEEAARRELFEESSLEVKSLEKIAVIDFSWQNKEQDLEVHVFHCDNFVGEPEESEEMKPEWFDIDNIPYKKMWDDDQYWFPVFLEGKKFKADFLFNKSDKIIEHKINVLPKNN
ncbi:MAG: 8-oxo-dGTP diphosphatase [Candidatus Komeilibacteria bacterium]|nr:8-oxo-dGTP diphosphatase [Candidatus Komeilibacteria bacterium]